MLGRRRRLRLYTDNCNTFRNLLEDARCKTVNQFHSRGLTLPYISPLCATVNAKAFEIALATSTACRNPDPHSRPSFATVTNVLESVKTKLTECSFVSWRREFFA